MTPREAYQRLVTGDVEAVPVDDLEERTAANAVMPYPPGIPMLMSGENFGGADCRRSAICAECGFATAISRVGGVIEGAEIIDGTYHVLCVKKSSSQPKPKRTIMRDP